MPGKGPVNDAPQKARRRGARRTTRRAKARWSLVPANVRGALWLLVASGLFTGMVALIKLAGQTLHVTEILLFRQIVMMLLALPAVVGGFPGSLRSARPDYQVLRIIAAVSAMLLSFTAFIHLHLAEAITIGFARTFFITIFAILILQEVVGLRRWAAMVVGFVGVLVVVQPGVEAGMNVYGLMAIGGAACAGLVMVIIRLMSRTDKPVTILSYQALGVGLLMVPPAIWFWKTPTLWELGLLAAIGAVGATAQMANIYAFRAGEASAIAPLDYTRLIWATGFGLVLFAEWPGVHVFLGAAIIIAAGLYTMYREQRLGAKRATREVPPPAV